MQALLRLAGAIDTLTDRFGALARWAVLLAVLISGANALVRYAFNTSSNAWLEIQWYLFAACVMLGAAQVLRLNEHVRVDLVYGRLSARAKVWIDLIGCVAFLLPVIGLLAVLSWQHFMVQFSSGEVSSNAGGLIRWPAALMLPVGFALVWLQGVAEVIKRVGWLTHLHDMDTHYERPLQ
ncbi:MAG: TRAP transporter small permease subunit [Leptothrix sp. (in: b-proteobacteria)]